MRPTNNFDFSLDEFEDYDWLFAPESKGKDIFPVRENIELAAKLYKVDPKFLEDVDEALRTMASELVGAMKADLRDMYNLLKEE